MSWFQTQGKTQYNTCSPLKKTSKKIKLTDEQKDIIKIKLKREEVMKVNAFAGTGKTFTLVEYAKANMDKKFLYLAFNRAIKEEAGGKFPGNVECRTSHSLAWKIGQQYKHKLEQGNFRIYTLMKLFGLDSARDARIIRNTFFSYLASEDKDINRNHITSEDLKDFIIFNGLWGLNKFSHEDLLGNKKRGMKKKAKKELDNWLDIMVNYTKELWIRMQDVNNFQVPMVHDGYLKLFQLTHPTLNYDCILFDEAQDSNPVTTNIVMNQKASKVLVGDSYQGIYLFRGSKDSMKKINSDRDMYLTKCFRFGEPIARLGNTILEHFAGEKRKMEGVGEGGDICNVETGKHTVLTRTNAFLFGESARNLNKRLFFVGGVDGYKFNIIEETYHLWKGNLNLVKDPFLKNFKSFNELNKYAAEAEDKEITARIFIIKDYGDNIPFIVKKINEVATKDIKESGMILSTAHKSKGLEFEKVRLTNDFAPLLDQYGKIKDDVKAEDVNVLYVALTRTKDKLQVNDTIEDFLKVLNGESLGNKYLPMNKTTEMILKGNKYDFE